MLGLGCCGNASAPAEPVEAPAAEAATEMVRLWLAVVLEWFGALRGKARTFSKRLGKTGSSGSEDRTTAGNGVKEVSKDLVETGNVWHG